MDGVSLTHGAAGSRQHIWSFVAAVQESGPTFVTCHACFCTNTNVNWPHQVPSFEGTITFALLEILGLISVSQLFILTTLCGIERGVVLLIPDVISTTLHGSAQLYHNPLQTT